MHNIHAGVLEKKTKTKTCLMVKLYTYCSMKNNMWKKYKIDLVWFGLVWFGFMTYQPL